MKKIIKIFLAIIIIPLLILIRIISPIILIRFHPINSQRLGHFLSNVEIYLCEKKFFKRRKIIIDLNFFNFDRTAKKQICNFQVGLMIKRKLNILPTKLIYPFFYFNSFFKDKEKFIAKNFYSDRDAHGLFDQYKNNFEFTKDEEERGQELLRGLGIKKGDKFICLNVRDSAFLESYFSNKDFSYHQYRNWDIANFQLAIEELINKNYFVIRVGKKSYSKLNLQSKKYIDLNNNFDDDFLDIYLGAKCDFCITTQSGFDSIPYVFRRPILYLTVPISHFHISSKRYLLATKHHFLKGNKISLNSLLKNNLFHFNYNKEFEENDLELKELSQTEILNLTIDMLNILNDKINIDAERDKQNLFWKNFLESNKNIKKTKNLHVVSEAIFAPSLYKKMISDV